MDDVLKYAVEHGMIDLSGVQKQIEMDKRQELLKKHPYRIWQGKDGRYRTYIADGGSKYGRKLIVKRSLGDIENFIVDYAKSKNIMTFAKVFEIVVNEKQKYVKNPQKALSVHNTVLKWKSDYKRFFAGTDLENKDIEEISKDDLEELCFKNLQKYSLKKKAFDGLIAIIRKVYKKAFEEYWVTDNTFLRMNLGKFQDMLIEPTDIRQRCYSDEQVQQIVEYLHVWQEQHPQYLPCYALELQIIMGLRRGEIPPLEWSDIKNGYIEITKEQITVKAPRGKPEYFEIVDHTKTWRDRRYPITYKVDEFLTRLKAVHTKFYSGSKYLFPADAANGVITNNMVYGFYRRTLRRLCISQEKGITKGTHSFRRNAISKVVNADGGSFELASKLFGNTPRVAEKNYYTGLDMVKVRDILNTI